MLISGLNEKWWNALSPSGNAIKLSGRTFLAPHRGSCPKGLCKRTGFLGVKRRENPVRRHFERSEMRGLRSGIAFAASPGGEVSRYDANSDCICMSIESPLNRDTQYWETSDGRWQETLTGNLLSRDFGVSHFFFDFSSIEPIVPSCSPHKKACPSQGRLFACIIS